MTTPTLGEMFFLGCVAGAWIMVMFYYIADKGDRK